MDRELLFPEHFFCHECKDWENQNCMQKHENISVLCQSSKYFDTNYEAKNVVPIQTD